MNKAPSAYQPDTEKPKYRQAAADAQIAMEKLAAELEKAGKRYAAARIKMQIWEIKQWGNA